MIMNLQDLVCYTNCSSMNTDGGQIGGNALSLPDIRRQLSDLGVVMKRLHVVELLATQCYCLFPLKR